MINSKTFKRALVVVAAVCITQPLQAAEIPQEVTARLQKLLPGTAPSEVRSTPVSGLFEARYGTTILYLSADGRYLVDGEMLDLESRKNMTDERIALARVEVLSGLDESEMVVYTPEETRRTLTIFTDIDCPYCVRLHEEREELLDAGIKLRYLLYPRAGFNSPSYQKAVTVWCSEDRAAALTAAKSGEQLDEKSCENPVMSQMRIAATFGLKGTPHIVVDDGEVISGYMPAKNMIGKLGL